MNLKALEEMDADIHVERLNAKEVIMPERW